MTAGAPARPSLLAIAGEWILPSRTMRRRLLAPAIGLGYIALIGLLGGLRSDHVFVGLLGLLDLYNEKTRLFLRQFLQHCRFHEERNLLHCDGFFGRVDDSLDFSFKSHESFGFQVSSFERG